MNLFLCHTPLHVLIGMMVAHENIFDKSIFVIVEDSAGLHRLARTMLDHQKFEIYFLPGMVAATNIIERTLIMRSNVKFLQKKFQTPLTTFYLFHDLRAEPQFLLNTVGARGATKCVMLEDGIALYEPREKLHWSLAAIVGHKIAAGTSWIHAAELGTHPNISQIRCFYPDLLRFDLRGKAGPPLSVNVPDLKILCSSRTSNTKNRSTIIIFPHTGFVSREYISEFLWMTLEYCKNCKTKPMFKIHPRDELGKKMLAELIPAPVFLPKYLPAELIAMESDNVHSIIGARTSSLHIIKKLRPSATVAYFGDARESGDIAWADFFRGIGVVSIKDLT